jgi:hypothetical protein
VYSTFPRRATPVSTTAPAPNVTVQVNQPPAEATPFGVDARLSELQRRLDDVEREISQLKAEQAALKTRDSTFESRLAELVAAKESLERSAQDIQRSWKNFQSSIEVQQDETRALVKDVIRIAGWRTVIMILAAFFGGAALKLLEKVIPGLARTELRDAAQVVVSWLSLTRHAAHPDQVPLGQDLDLLGASFRRPSATVDPSGGRMPG